MTHTVIKSIRIGRSLFHLYFFFSSRRRHTRWNCDWSSDVCSSDLRTTIDFGKLLDFLRGNRRLVRAHAYRPTSPQPGDDQMFLQAVKGLGYRITTKNRSEERRVGKECRSRWSPDEEKNKRNRQRRR